MNSQEYRELTEAYLAVYEQGQVPNPYRPGATIRATGPGMNRFPELQRFASQAQRVTKPVSQTVGAVTALRTPAGAAAAVMAPRPTAPGTLSSAPKLPTRPGQVKTGQTYFDYSTRVGPHARPAQRLKVGPKIVGPKLSTAQSFDKAFADARKSGKSGFEWRGKTYTTQMKENYDYSSLIIDYLIDEGYAKTAKAAYAIAENMSENWTNLILEQLFEDIETRSPIKNVLGPGVGDWERRPSTSTLELLKRRTPSDRARPKGNTSGVLTTPISRSTYQGRNDTSRSSKPDVANNPNYVGPMQYAGRGTKDKMPGTSPSQNPRLPNTKPTSGGTIKPKGTGNWV